MRWVLAFVLLLVASPASAATCRVVNVTPLAFGAYVVGTQTPVDGNGQIAVECDANVGVRIMMSRGVNGRQTPREMTFRNASLAYNLFLDAARTATWGDGSEGTQFFSGMVVFNQTLNVPIFGRVLALQAVPPGVYTDRITAFVVF